MRIEKSAILIALFMLVLSAIGQTNPNPGNTMARSEVLKNGVVIESVEEGFEAARQGLKPGDKLLRWSRGSEEGAINSPFDLVLIEIEQSPRGAVTIEGTRREEHLTWTLGQDEWQLKARPGFSPDLLAQYKEARESAKAGKLQQEVESWKAIALRVQQNQNVWLSSWLLFHAAEVMGEHKAWSQADSFYQQAVERASEMPPAMRACLLGGWVYSFIQRDDWADAEKRSREAIEASRESGNESLLTAWYMVARGRVLESQGDLALSLEEYRQALAIQQALAPGSIAAAQALFRLGHASWQGGDLGVAESEAKKALAIQEALTPGAVSVAQSLALLAHIRADSGDLAEAEDYYRQAMRILSARVPASPVYAEVLSGLGIVLTNRGNLVEAEQYYRQALAIHEKSDPGGQGTGVILSLLGQLAWARGDLAKSEREFLNAADILRKTGPETRYYAYCLLGLGVLNDLKGDSAKAEDYWRQTLAIQMKTAPSQLFTADALSRLGNVVKKRGDFAAAEDLYVQALAIQNAHSAVSPRTAQTLGALCDLADQRGNLDKAEEYCRKELTIVEQLTPGTTDHAAALASLAGILRKKRQEDAAAQLYEKTLSALENQMARLGGSKETQAGFRADHASYYSEYAGLLVSQKRFSEAFQVIERSRARTLLETLASAHADIRKGVDSEFLGKERLLQTEIDAASEKRFRLLSNKHTDEQVKTIEKEIDDLLARYQEIEGQIRATSPSYAALTQPQPLSAGQIQQLLDNDTLLLEYSLGDERSYLFAVTSASLAAFELPKRVVIEDAARHLYETLRINPNAGPRGAQAGRTEYLEVSSRLSQMILGPVTAQLKNKRLLVVADGALQYIPFAILVEPENQSLALQSSVPLVVNHEIVALPSASILGVLRQEEKDRKRAPRAVAVLADPVFDKQDPRISSVLMHGGRSLRIARGTEANMPVSTGNLSSDLLARSASDVGLSREGQLRLPRLLFSREEASAIMAATPKGKGMEALDFKATRAAAISPELGQYRIVHFATHGLLNSEHPELSGLVFSLVDKNGKPQDGFLQLQDIYNMNLPADLVVLSACETALGKEINGEGLIGLTRGFMYAGASRVVASLWKVSDVATARLMANFYTAMEKDGLPPAAALRAAQVSMWKQKRWKSPYYWAAFQIQGEYR